jgi:drug/metabolite transporter (DMT)-like permease
MMKGLKTLKDAQSWPLRSRQILVAALTGGVVALVFGAYSVVAHRALAGASLSPLVFALSRDTLAVICLMAAAYLRYRSVPSSFWPASADVPRFIACGVLGVYCSQAGSALALKYLDPLVYTLIQPLMPLATALWATLAGQEAWALRSSATWLKLLGMLVAVGGAAFVGWGGSVGSAASGTNLLLGLFFVALQILGGGAYPVAQQPLMGKYPSLVVCAWGYAYGWLALAMCAITSATDASDWSFTPSSAGAVLFAGLLASALNYALMALCVELAGSLLVVRWPPPPSRFPNRPRPTPHLPHTALQVTFLPLMGFHTAWLQWVFEGHLLSLDQGVGGALCFLGLVIFVVGKGREAEVPAEGAVGSQPLLPLLPLDAEEEL